MEHEFTAGTNYKETFIEAVQALVQYKFPTPWRVEAVKLLTEKYVEQTGERPDSKMLTRLTNYILAEDFAKPEKNKVQTTEYPFLSKNQFVRRKTAEMTVPDVDGAKGDSSDEGNNEGAV